MTEQEIIKALIKSRKLDEEDSYDIYDFLEEQMFQGKKLYDLPANTDLQSVVVWQSVCNAFIVKDKKN